MNLHSLSFAFYILDPFLMILTPVHEFLEQICALRLSNQVFLKDPIILFVFFLIFSLGHEFSFIQVFQLNLCILHNVLQLIEVFLNIDFFHLILLV